MRWRRDGPGRAALSNATKRRIIAWHAYFTAPCGRRSIRPPAKRGGGGGVGGLLTGNVFTNTGRTVADFLREKHPDIRVPPVENPTYVAFKEYKEVPETDPLDFLENNVTWVASKISGAAGVIGAESINLRNWILCLGCASEEFIVVVADLAAWMANSSPPWDAYCDMMACRLVAMDTRPGVCPVGIS